MDRALQGIAERYQAQVRTPISARLQELYATYVRDREDSLVDAASAAASIGAIIHYGEIDFSSLTPQATEAFHLAYPHMDMTSLSSLSTDQLQGVVNGWKGKLFEVLVRDRLNNGGWVGDLHLLTGQHAELANSLTQPGWDLQILSPDGHVSSELQLKASESLAYAKSALEHYPHIDVITTHEAASHGADTLSQIIDSGMSDHDLSDAVSAPLEQLSDHGVLGFVEDVAPFLPFVIIAATEGRYVFMGKKSFEVAVAHALERTWKTGAAMGVGAAVIWLDGGLLSIPASLLTRIGIERFQITGAVTQKFNIRTVQAKALRGEYSRS